jgi:tetratricopeptide (TPR) repeat protein
MGLRTFSAHITKEIKTNLFGTCRTMRQQHAWLASTFILLSLLSTQAPGRAQAEGEQPGLPAYGFHPNKPEEAKSNSKPAKAEVDFGPYMADIQKRIKKVWNAPKDELSRNIQVLFDIHADGHISQLRLAPSADTVLPNPAAGQAALRAVRQSAPFRPLPNGAPESVAIQFNFAYNVIENGKRVTGTLAELREIGMRYYGKRKYPLATKIFSKLTTMDGGNLFEEKSNRATDFNWLGDCYYMQHRYLQAADCFEKAIFVRINTPGSKSAWLPPELPNLDFFMAELTSDLATTAKIYANHGARDRANNLYKNAISAARNAYGPNNELVGHLLQSYLSFAMAQNSFSTAETANRELLSLQIQTIGALNPKTLETLHDLEAVLVKQGKLKEAEDTYKKLMARYENGKEIDDPDMANCLSHVASFYVRHKEYSQAEDLLKRALAIRVKLHDPIARTVRQNLTDVYSLENRPNEAEVMLAEAVERDFKGDDRLLFANDLEDLASHYLSQKNYTKAIELLNLRLVRLNTIKASDKEVQKTLRLLGASYEDQNQLSQAESYYSMLVLKYFPKLSDSSTPSVVDKSTDQIAFDVLDTSKKTDPFGFSPPDTSLIEKQPTKVKSFASTTSEFYEAANDIDRLADLEIKLGHPERAIDLYNEFWNNCHTEWQERMVSRKLTQLYLTAKRYKEAEAILKPTVPDKFRQSYWLGQDTFADLYELASIYANTGRQDKAEQTTKDLIASVSRPDAISYDNNSSGIYERAYVQVPEDDTLILMQSTNGTIGPQGGDTTIIQGVNTAGTVTSRLIGARDPIPYKATDGSERVEPTVCAPVFPSFEEPCLVGTCWPLPRTSTLSKERIYASRQLALAKLSADVAELCLRRNNGALAQTWFKQSFAHLSNERKVASHTVEIEHYNLIRKSILEQYSKLPGKYRVLSLPAKKNISGTHNGSLSTVH